MLGNVAINEKNMSEMKKQEDVGLGVTFSKKMFLSKRFFEGVSF